ncbi:MULTISPECIES: extracellular catalytic domain type 1 short-chain-length polyhydroxyalkanoate depolymerase [Colwellia]|uniref:Poly(3-hydroxybutyrate) depolymerase LpqC n=1 Tax=Colwellia marinimaniae TaxID=1513592 RepID=A0ABQ0MTI1_9GAMM|nr:MULTISPECIES: PHB depolymerase family esterase [Colwellia]GAW95675.1 putative poly(3-hydroxybutyrate) depolymerase LpqC [Colwellia marinimaniae]
MLPLIRKISSIALLFISTAALATAQPLEDSPPRDNFQPLTHFGDNPGNLTASYLSPSKQAKSLVVLLHGCVQKGETLAKQSGFVALARQHNFTLLLPQQSKKNNVKSCFNWFSEQDITKDQGEVLSIKNMINTVKAQENIEQVYIAGLSAGGAMTSALLTHYPKLFSAGAVIAGLPYPCANDLAKAISCMRNGPSQSAIELVSIAKQGNAAIKKWPRLIVITGSNDKVVNPKNSHRLALQWSKLSENLLAASKTSSVDYKVTLWQDEEERPQVKLVEINDLGHGLTVNSSLKNRDASAPFLFESSLDSASNIIEFWQLIDKT